MTTHDEEVSGVKSMDSPCLSWLVNETRACLTFARTYFRVSPIAEASIRADTAAQSDGLRRITLGSVIGILGETGPVVQLAHCLHPSAQTAGNN